MKYLLFTITTLFLFTDSFSQLNQRNIFKGVIQNYTAAKVAEYDITFFDKCFDCDSFSQWDYNLKFINNEDTFLGAYFFYEVSLNNKPPYYKYYDGKKLSVLSPIEEKFISYDPLKHHLSPIRNSSDGFIIKMIPVFKEKNLNIVFNKENDSKKFYDTLIGKTPYLVIMEHFPDQGDYKNQYRKMFINSEQLLIDSIYYYTEYFDQTQINILSYRLLATNHITLDTLTRLRDNIIATHKLEEKMYEPKKEEPYTLGSEFAPFAAAQYPYNRDSFILNYKGKVMILDFWYTACLPCIESIPHINKIFEKYKDKITIYGVDPYEQDATDSNQIAQFQRRTPIHYPILFAKWDDLYNYKIQAFPTLYIFDKEGKLIFSQIGYNNDEDLYEKIDKVLSNTQL